MNLSKSNLMMHQFEMLEYLILFYFSFKVNCHRDKLPKHRKEKEEKFCMNLSPSGKGTNTK